MLLLLAYALQLCMGLETCIILELYALSVGKLNSDKLDGIVF